jgi:hydroxyacylglutathione hydrolase
MKDEPRIIRIPLGRVNAYFVVGDGQVILIDTGEKRNEKRILQALATLGLSLSEIRLIILTHTHYDHCGSVRGLKEMTAAKVIVHQNEASCLREGYSGFPKGTSPVTKAISWIGRSIGSRIGRYAPVEPDIIVSERFGLEEYGTEGYIVPTPGHTSGSMSVIISNRYALVGDTLFNIFRKSLFPPFADDQEELLKSWAKLIDIGCRTFYPGHGSRFEVEKFRQSLERERKRSGLSS